MRFTALTTLLVLGAACGEKKPEAYQAAAATPPAQAVPAPASEGAAAVVEVKMTGNGSTKAAFEPATLTIKPGTVVRFINVAGGPHNVAFYADSIPKGAADALKKGMPNAMGDLMSPFLTQPNEKYDVSFTGAPTGKYRAYCMPHVALGMFMTITVQ
jgi:plastocyanin